MTAKSWFAAAIGALLTPLTFRYVLANAWMASYVPGAPEIDLTRVLLSVIAGALLLMLIPALTARWSGARNQAEAAGAGAVAGLLIGGTVFALYGVPAAGAAGARELYPYLSASPPEGYVGVVYTVSSAIVRWTLGLGWAMWSIGGLIGGVIGLLTGARPIPEERRRSMTFAGRLLLALLVIFVCMSLIVSVVMVTPLRNLQENGVAIVSLRNQLVASLALVPVILLGVLLRQAYQSPPLSRHIIQYQAWGALFLGCVTLLTVGVVIGFGGSLWRSLAGAALAVIAVQGFSLLLLARRYFILAPTCVVRSKPPHVADLLMSALGGGELLAILVSMGIGLVQNINILLVPLLPIISGRSDPTNRGPITAAELAKSNYIIHANTFITVQIACIIGFVILMALLGGAVHLIERTRSNEPLTPERTASP